jgi:hypothetical protein
MSYVTSLLHNNRKPALYSLPLFFISSQLVFRRRCMDLFVYSPICCCFCDVTTLTNKVHANTCKCAHTHSVAFSRHEVILGHFPCMHCPKAEFLDEIQTKVLRVSRCYSQSSLQLCIEISISSNSHSLLQFPQFS